MTIEGKVWKFGDNIDTDVIIPARFLNVSDKKLLAASAFADLRPDFSKGVHNGDILVGGSNFGCGSSREQAASCLKGADLVVVARNFARIFLQNSINLGLKTVICPEIEADEGDELEIIDGAIINKSSGRIFALIPLPKSRQAIIDAGGLINYTRERLVKSNK